MLYRLEQNYRSTAVDPEAANALIANNAGRLGKTLWTSGARGEPVKLYAAFNERDEADFVVTRILEWYASAAGVRRDSRDPVSLQRAVAQLRGGADHGAHTLPRLRRPALLRARRNQGCAGVPAPDRQSRRRRLVRAHGEPAAARHRRQTLDAIREAARGAGSSLWRAAAAVIAAARAGARPAALIELPAADRAARAQRIAGLPLHEQVDHVINASGLIEHHQKDKADRGEARVENLLELVSAARGFEPEGELPPLQSFLAHAVLESGEAQGDAFEDCVQMMTLHSAKGLEFPLVFLCGMEDGLFPHQRSLNDLEGLEEERRLCYVGMTRAMRQLYFTYAEQRRLHGVDSYNAPSRFIRRSPPSMIEEVRPRIRLSHAPRSEDGGARAARLRRGTRSLIETMGGGMRLGTRVRHGKFGEGVVLNVEGQGPHARVQVNFEQQGSNG